MGVSAVVIALVLVAAAPVAGQTAGQTAASKAKTTAATAWTPPRTPDGHPDLQGQWTNTTTTRLERPEEFQGKQVLTAEELAEQNRVVAERLSFDRPPRAGDPGAYNDFWIERGSLSKRTSLIVEPPDGKLPPLTPDEKKRQAEREEARKTSPADGPEALGVYSRCITRGLPGAMMPGFYNHNYHILQTPGYVVILVEMIHDARIIPLDGRPHAAKGIRQWLGDSRGRWEGNTLVVETTNFITITDRSVTNFGTSETARVIERFTRVDPDTIDYQVTVDDPVTFTKPWTAAIPMRKLEGQIFEYACHEGNYAMRGMLAGARAQERAAEEAAKKQNR
jgi:hypothetical protein